MFKEIRHIDDIWPFVKDVEAIKLNVKEDEGFQVINYQFTAPDTFDIPESLECRGIKFDLDGNIIARPFHKFFNLNERQTSDELDWDGILSIEAKHDGSMVHAVVLPKEPNRIRLMTRAGFSDQAQMAHDTAMTPQLEAEMLSYILRGYTPIYEFVSPANRIVLKYDEPRLILLAVRHMVTGEYLNTVEENRLDINARGEDLHEKIKALKDEEGVIVVWPCGHRIKIKADEYVLLHKTKEALEREINVIRCIFDGTVDDLYGIIDGEHLYKLKTYVSHFYDFFTDISDRAEFYCSINAEKEQKEFAIKLGKDRPKILQGLYFKMRQDMSDPLGTTLAYFNARLVKQDRVDEMAEILQEFPRWEY